MKSSLPWIAAVSLSWKIVFSSAMKKAFEAMLRLTSFPHVNSDVYLDWLGPAPLLTFCSRSGR